MADIGLQAVNRALNCLSSSSKNSPIVVRLSGLVQTNDRLAIREMGRQIAHAEGRRGEEADEDGEGEGVEAEEVGSCCSCRLQGAGRCKGTRRHAAYGQAADEQEYAPTTLPSHLLALLTAPSPRAIIIIIDEFDLFTEHARQALLYCLREYTAWRIGGKISTNLSRCRSERQDWFGGGNG